MAQPRTESDRLDAIFSALADPTRRAILKRLASGEATVMELAEPFDMTLPAVSKHLKVLERAGLIVRGRDKQWRPCKLDPAPLQEVATWLEAYRQFWEESFDRLDEYLHLLQERSAARPADSETSAPTSDRRDDHLPDEQEKEQKP
jgi:DNA-binding transcriptional ArsR family regulator